MERRGANATEGVPGNLMEYLESLMRGKKSATLEGTLQYLEYAHADRVLILPSAWKSARESDKAGFSPVEGVADLAFLLVREYVDARRSGAAYRPQDIFGYKNYAHDEGKPLTASGTRARTFAYDGKDVLMLEHLKVGVGWNLGTTFRAHFAYDADLGKVVIGHFGKHLNR